MKILRLVTVVLFAITTLAYLVVSIVNLKKDKTLPQITIDTPSINVSLGSDRTELMQGIKAIDGKDGDITDKVIIESISRFVEPGVAIVKYAVCDSDNHVTSASRTIVYQDYVSPRFTLNSSLVFNITESVNVLNKLGATDLIDGDISDKLIISTNDYTANAVGVYYISAKAANSRGDIIYLQLPIYVEDLSLSAPIITLSNYLVYLKSGEGFDIQANLVSVFAADGTDLTAQTLIDTDLDPNTPGIYQAHYYATDAAGRKGHAILTLIVEE